MEYNKVGELLNQTVCYTDIILWTGGFVCAFDCETMAPGLCLDAPGEVMPPPHSVADPA